MIQDKKLEKLCNDFSLLNPDQQDYIIGILQALVFAKNSNNDSDAEKARIDVESNPN